MLLLIKKETFFIKKKIKCFDKIFKTILKFEKSFVTLSKEALDRCYYA